MKQSQAAILCTSDLCLAAQRTVYLFEDDSCIMLKVQIMRERIAVSPGIHFGKPCVAGSRIPVQSVLELVREGLTFGDIVRDYYPELTPEDIQACIQYAIDVVAVEEIHLATAP